MFDRTFYEFFLKSDDMDRNENCDFELNVIYKSKLYESISKLGGVKILEIWY